MISFAANRTQHVLNSSGWPILARIESWNPPGLSTTKEPGVIINRKLLLPEVTPKLSLQYLRLYPVVELTVSARNNGGNGTDPISLLSRCTLSRPLQSSRFSELAGQFPGRLLENKFLEPCASKSSFSRIRSRRSGCYRPSQNNVPPRPGGRKLPLGDADDCRTRWSWRHAGTLKCFLWGSWREKKT